MTRSASRFRDLRPRDDASEDETPWLTRKGFATRNRIVAAAAGLMFERGVAATTIEQVRRSAGVSGSQMTHYFKDKRSLVSAVIAYRAEPTSGQTFDTFSSFEQWASDLVELQVARQCVGGCELGTLASELSRVSDDFRVELDRSFDIQLQRMSAGLRAMKERGELRDDADPDALALVMVTAHQGGVLLTQTKRDVQPLRLSLGSALEHLAAFVL